MNTIAKIKKKLTKEKYRLFIKELITINKTEGKLPTDININGTIIYKNEYIETIEQTNKFILENKRHPEVITIKEKKQHNK